MMKSSATSPSTTSARVSTSASCKNRSAQSSGGGGGGVILGSGLLAAYLLALVASATIIAPVAGHSIGAVGGGGGGGIGNQLDAALPTAALCEPGLVEKMPPHIRKICTALESATQLSSSLYAYLHNQRSALLYQPDELALTAGSGIDKRTDVDHVFLRFGRRR